MEVDDNGMLSIVSSESDWVELIVLSLYLSVVLIFNC